jgi:hypothetical protein
MHSRCMRRRPSHLSPAKRTRLNVGFLVRSEPTSAHAPQSRRGVDSTHCAGDTGAHAERRLLVRSERDGPPLLPTVSSDRLLRDRAPRSADSSRARGSDYAQRRSRARSAIDGGTPSKRGARDQTRWPRRSRAPPVAARSRCSPPSLPTSPDAVADSMLLRHLLKEFSLTVEASRAWTPRHIPRDRGPRPDDHVQGVGGLPSYLPITCTRAREKVVGPREQARPSAGPDLGSPPRGVGYRRTSYLRVRARAREEVASLIRGTRPPSPGPRTDEHLGGGGWGYAHTSLFRVRARESRGFSRRGRGRW